MVIDVPINEIRFILRWCVSISCESKEQVSEEIEEREESKNKTKDVRGIFSSWVVELKTGGKHNLEKNDFMNSEEQTAEHVIQLEYWSCADSRPS